MYTVKNVSKQRCQELILVFVLFMSSLLVRALFGIYGIELDRPFTGDEGGFHWRALRLIDGELGQRAHRAPFTAIAIAPSYWLFGSAPEVGRWMMVIISSFGAPLLFFLGKRLSGSYFVGLFAGLYWVVYPPSIFYSTLIYSETISAVLIIASVLCYFSAAASSARLLPAVLTGMLWGCLALNRATFLLLPFGVLFFVLIPGLRLSPRTKFRTSQWLITFVAFIAVLTPWTIHTYDLYGTFMPHNTRGGWALLMSNGNLDDPMVKEGGYSRESSYGFPKLDPRPNKQELDNLQRKLAIKLIGEHLRNRPFDYLSVVTKRVRNYWSWRPDPYDSTWTRNDWIMLFFWAPVILVVVISPALRRWREFWPLSIVVIYSFFIALPFWGTPRFRYPVDPLMVLMASWGLIVWMQWIQKRARIVKK